MSFPKHPYLERARYCLDQNFHHHSDTEEKKNLYDALSRMAATLEGMDRRLHEMQATIDDLKARRS